MKVYHGTGDYALNPSIGRLDGLLKGKPIRNPKHYLSKPHFSTTSSFNVACLFAVRKSSPDDFFKGKMTGVVIEYELAGIEGKDFKKTRDPCCIQEEHEVAVFEVNYLKPLAVWRNIQGEWQQEKIA